MIIRKAILGKILIFWLAFVMIDFSLAMVNKGPVFSIPLIVYKDGGSAECYGLGYKVIKYVNLTGVNGAEAEVERVDFGTWFMKFSPPK